MKKFVTFTMIITVLIALAPLPVHAGDIFWQVLLPGLSIGNAPPPRVVVNPGYGYGGGYGQQVVVMPPPVMVAPPAAYPSGQYVWTSSGWQWYGAPRPPQWQLNCPSMPCRWELH